MDKNSFRMLLIVGGLQDYRYIQKLLKNAGPEEYSLEWVKSIEAAQDALARTHFDVCLAESGADGIEASGIIKYVADFYPELSVIALVEDEDAVKRIARLGVADCLVKGRIDPSVWGRSLRFALERTRLLSRLHEQEELCRNLVEQAGDIIHTHDLEGRHTSINRAGEEKKGWRLTVENNSRLLDEESVAVAVQGVALEVTEGKRAEGTRALLATIVESSDDAIMSADAGGRITSWNRGAERIYGYTVVEAVGRHTSLIIPPGRLEKEREVIERLGRGARLEHYVTKGLTKDGRLLDVSLTVSPLIDAGGKVTGTATVSRNITEDKRVEEVLRSGRQQLQLITDSAPVCIAYCDREQRYRFVNKMYFERFGLKREEIIGKHIAEVLGPEVYSSIRPHVEAALRGEQVDFELLVPYQGLGPRYMHCAYAPEFDARGEAAGFVAVLSDISERKHSEGALQRQALAFETINEGIVITDPGGYIVDWNPAAERIFGQTREEVLGTHASLTIHTRRNKRLELEIFDAVSQKGRWEGEMPFTRGDGTEGWAEVVIIPHVDAEGKLTSFIGVNRDVTERRRAEGARAKLLHDLGERVKELTVLHRAARVLQNEELTKDEVMRELIALLPAGWQYPEVTAARIRLGDAERATPNFIVTPWMQRTDFKTTDGKLGEVEVAYLEERPAAHEGPFLSEERTMIDSVAEMLRTDINRRHSAEMLRQAQKMEAVGHMAGGLAHDFNNLLTAINGYSDLSLSRVEQGGVLSQNLREIRKAGERAATLTRQLLAFSRKQVLQPKVIDLNVVVADVEKILHRLIGEDVELLTRFAQDLRRVKADRGQLEQVIMNLAVNARDAMPHGGKLILQTENVELDEEYASRHVEVSPGRYVVLAVSDTGSGMDAETRARVFEPFFTTKEVGKGTGLGLSTVYGIVKQSGGNVWVYSEVGVGTTLKIYLPIVEEELEKLPQIRAEATPQHGSETILLTEDDDLVRRMACEILKMYGYKVLEASRGGEAIRICEQYGEKIHLLLTDVVMPQLSGREVADCLTHIRPGLKVVFMSGYTDEAVLHHGALKEGDAFLQKPFTPDALARKVREALDAN
jgi:PAS domain S-box-containing protein